MRHGGQILVDQLKIQGCGGYFASQVKAILLRLMDYSKVGSTQSLAAMKAAFR